MTYQLPTQQWTVNVNGQPNRATIPQLQALVWTQQRIKQHTQTCRFKFKPRKRHWTNVDFLSPPTWTCHRLIRRGKHICKHNHYSHKPNTIPECNAAVTLWMIPYLSFHLHNGLQSKALWILLPLVQPQFNTANAHFCTSTLSSVQHNPNFYDKQNYIQRNFKLMLSPRPKTRHCMGAAHCHNQVSQVWVTTKEAPKDIT
jgi:hypothetical protein